MAELNERYNRKGAGRVR